MAFRGHREDGEHLNDLGNNPGNFKALLKLLKDTGNPDIIYLMKKAPRNATYTSKTIYEQIIDVIGESITDYLIGDAKKANFFSILADEARDISNKEQLALVIRFVDGKLQIREEFIKFVHCNTGLSGEALSKLLLHEIEELGLSMEKCRGQAYDGAGAMAGCQSGAATRISNDFPLAIFIHCFSHRLNLSVMLMIKVKPVRDMFDTVRVISDYFNDSAKRYERFLEVIQKELGKEEGITKLIDICRTRWIQRIDGLTRFKEAYRATYKALKLISKGDLFHDTKWNAESRAAATGLAVSMEKFEFILAMVVCQELMQYIYSLTISLQSSTLAIVEAYHEVATVIETLEGLKLNVKSHHKIWYDEAVRVAATINVTPAKKRTCFFQAHRDNIPVDDICEFYRISITIPVLNEVVEDLRRRFKPENIVFINGFYCIPNIMEKYPNEWKQKLLSFMRRYKKDMPNPESCLAEIECWETLWSKHFTGEAPSTLEDTFSHIKPAMYPNITTVLTILGTIPVTTCTCERCMSVMRRLKTYMRSSMGQGRFNDLATLQIHYDLKICEDDILDRLVLKYPKRIRMANILHDT